MDGSETLKGDASADETPEFKARAQKAFSTIVLAMRSSQLYLIISTEEPKAAWDALRKHFERLSSKETVPHEKILLYGTEGRYKHGTTLEPYESITDKLAAIGAPISQEDQVVYLLGSLPKAYAVLVTALEARAENRSLDYVQQALMHEELKQGGEQRTDRAEAALIGKPGKGKHESPGCFKCNAVGHIRRNCPLIQSKSQKPFQSTHKVKTAEDQTPTDSDNGKEGFSGAFTASIGDLVKENEKRWLIDSGASSHMTNDKDLLINYKAIDEAENVALGDGHAVKAHGYGNVYMKIKFDKHSSKKEVLYDVPYVPKLTNNLSSVRAAVTKSNTVKFGCNKCLIRDESGILRGTGTLLDKLYHLDCEVVTDRQMSAVAFTEDNDLWHQQLVHVNEQSLHRCINNGYVNGIRIKKMTGLSFCEVCCRKIASKTISCSGRNTLKTKTSSDS